MGQLLLPPVGAFGTYAEYVAVSERATLTRIPSGVAEIVDIATPLAEVVARSHRDGIDALIDVVNEADDFAALAALVRNGGSALTTRYVADVDALAADGVAAINFQLPASSELLERVAEALAAKTIIPPPIKPISLVDAPAAFDGEGEPLFDGKTVIVM